MELSIKNNKLKNALVLLVALALSVSNLSLAVSLLETTEAMDVVGTLQGSESRARTPRRSTGKTTITRPEQIDIPTDIDSRYAAIADQINTGKKPEKTDILANLQLLKMTPAQINDLPEASRVRFYMLSAWTNYFNGDLKKAQQSAMKIYRTNPSVTDVRITQASMAFLAGSKPAAPIKKRVTKDDDSDKTEINLLNLDIDSVITEFIDVEVTQMQLQCLNSASMSFAPGQSSLCVLFWKLPESVSAFSTASEPNSLSISSSGESELANSNSNTFASSTASFRNIVSSAYANPEIKFVAVNTDDFSKKQAVVNTILSNPWPWVNVMAQDPQSQAIQFKSIRVRHEKPMLMLISNLGKITYAGPADGFLAPMLVSKAANTAITISPAARPRQTFPQTKPTTLQPAANNGIIRQVKNRKQEMSPADEFQADKLLKNAVMLIDMGSRYTTPKRGIEMCRQIIKDYPDTTYANEARLLLRKVPERYHKRYNITSEELGL